MYLRASRYVGGWSHGPDAEFAALTDLFGMSDAVTPDSPSATVSFTVAYWRKANAIHKWFVDNVQNGVDDCRYAYVEREQLIELRDLCALTLSSMELEDGQVHVSTSFDASGRHENFEPGKVVANAELPEQLLPTTSGFFFGGTDYDEWYVAGLKSTVEQINKALELDDSDWEFVYHSSW